MGLKSETTSENAFHFVLNLKNTMFQYKLNKVLKMLLIALFKFNTNVFDANKVTFKEY